MSKLFRTLFALGAIVFVISVGLIFISYDPNHYMIAGSDKYRYLHSIPPPRIILVGGSNVAFSVDSEKIEKSMHIPVVNMGLTAGLGLKFMINEIEAELQDGDILIIIPEYEQFHELPLEGRAIDLGSAAKYCPECFLTSNIVNDPQQLALAAAGLFQGIEGDTLAALGKQDEIYTRQGFDPRGDMTAHLAQTERRDILNHVLPLDPQKIDPAVDFLNSFHRSHRGENIRVILSFPAIPQREYYAQKKKFSALYDQLSAKLEFAIIGTPADFVYPVDLFYDTVYHMNAAGRDKRTGRLIELLAPMLGK
jgi:hypothetical protein